MYTLKLINRKCIYYKRSILYFGGDFMIKCPRCGKEVSTRPGTICPRCGLNVSEVTEKVRCPEPKCRALVSKKLEYCPKCGCKLKGYNLNELMRIAKSKIDKVIWQKLQ